MEFNFSNKQLAKFEECAKGSNQTLTQWVTNQLNNAADRKAVAEVVYHSESFQILLNELLDDVWRLNWVFSHFKTLRYSGRLTEGNSLHTNLNKLPYELLNLTTVSGETFQTEIVVLISRLFDRDVSTNSFSRLLEMLDSIVAADVYKSLEQLQIGDFDTFSSEFEAIKLGIRKLKSSPNVKDIVYKLRGKYVVHRETKFDVKDLPPNQVLFDAVSSINDIMSEILELFKPMPLDRKGSVLDFNSSPKTSSQNSPANKTNFINQKDWYYERAAALLTILEGISIKLQG